MQPIDRIDSTEVSLDISAQVNVPFPTKPIDCTRTDVTLSAPNNGVSRMISFRGVEYHMVKCGLILLKMLSEYIDINDFVPAMSSEVVHHVVELLKFLNTRTCHLVLGAGGLQDVLVARIWFKVYRFQTLGSSESGYQLYLCDYT